MTEWNAEARFARGPSGPRPGEPDPLSGMVRLLLALAALATLVVAAWLLTVIAFVLPGHDPSRIPMWRAVAAGFAAYSVASGVYLALGSRAAILRWPMRLVSIAAIALGIWGFAQMSARARAGVEFEGYLVLMALVITGHGLAGTLATLVPGAHRRGAPAR